MENIQSIASIITLKYNNYFVRIFVATNNEEDTVAVKLLKGRLSMLHVIAMYICGYYFVEESIKQDFIGAAYILSQFSHKNILSLLSFTVSPLMMIVTLMELCDLKKYLVRYCTAADCIQISFSL